MRFGDFPENYCVYETSRVVLLPIPFDKTSSWIKGADNGPEAILKASPALEWYDILTGVEVYREGIYTAPPILAQTPEEMIEEGYQQAKRHMQAGKFVVTLGGEHSVTLGPVRALAEACPVLSVLHLDAHGD
nr:arginase family protein [Candidatus Hydrogenedentota bacterium]